MNNSVISCTGLEKSFVDGVLSVEVLRGIELNVQTAEKIAIVGASGSGKSTLLHILGGLDLPTKGQVMILGKEFSGLSETVRGNIRNKSLGFIYQFHHLLPEFTALENVAMPLLLRQMRVQEALRDAESLLSKVGLSHRLSHKPGELSGGERQRAAIARAMVSQPQCILADEPTGNLDEHTADQVFATMQELNQEFNTSLIMVTHNHNLAKKMDTIYKLQEGRLFPTTV